MKKDRCGIIGYETVCLNGCCETVAFTDCAQRAKRHLKKAQRKR